MWREGNRPRPGAVRMAERIRPGPAIAVAGLLATATARTGRASRPRSRRAAPLRRAGRARGGHRGAAGRDSFTRGPGPARRRARQGPFAVERPAGPGRSRTVRTAEFPPRWFDPGGGPCHRPRPRYRPSAGGPRTRPERRPQPRRCSGRLRRGEARRAARRSGRCAADLPRPPDGAAVTDGPSPNCPARRAARPSALARRHHGTTVTGQRPAFTSRTATDPMRRCPADSDAPTITASAFRSSAAVTSPL